MKRTTVKLPDAVDAKLRHEALRRGISLSAVTREAIETHLGLLPAGPRRLLAAGAGRSGRDDIAERISELFQGEVAP